MFIQNLQKYLKLKNDNFLQIIVHNLWLNDTIKEAIDAKRIHHQLVPMRVDYEKDLEEVYKFFSNHIKIDKC